ncbi:TetR family transcriptional regulator [Microbacterium dauci]|uniref:TetR family transcriptional regulator n=1 Tax=Microbacterium dauci TaxID=3048008 RepID=A0ABT6ZFM4_9MICO|nr:TetR family transcriptional regulator [Microbacterium sp. LX3-4]MDJ1114781.1 TetR family transcriptional regulator [Microbacterium sp. LX3-4]
MTPGEDPVDAPAPGLRERRRRETLRELSDAALDLFEEQGVDGTTVDDITRRAGTSPRTFFRYYATKEAAVLPSTEDTESQIAAVADAIARGESLIRAIEANWLTILTEFDETPAEHARALRVRRLVGAEPTILALALRIEAEHADRLTDAAADATGPGADLLTIRAAVAATSLLVRLAFEEWAIRAEQGESIRVRETYLGLRRGLGSLAAQLTDDLEG